MLMEHIWSFPSREKRDFAFVELHCKFPLLTVRVTEDNPYCMIQSMICAEHDEHMRNMLIKLGGTQVS